MNTDDHIKILAGQLLQGFIPKNPNETELWFQFTLAPNHTYKVNFTKNKATQSWDFVAYELLDKQ